MKGKINFILTDNESGKIVTEQHDENMLTNALKLMIETAYKDKALPFSQDSAAKSLTATIKDFYTGGMVLYDEVQDDLPNNCTPPLCNIVGFGNTHNTAVHVKQGGLNAELSIETTNSKTWVWDFASSQGNGTIKSISLMPDVGAIAMEIEISPESALLGTMLNFDGSIKGYGASPTPAGLGFFIGVDTNGIEYFQKNISGDTIIINKVNPAITTVEFSDVIRKDGFSLHQTLTVPDTDLLNFVIYDSVVYCFRKVDTVFTLTTHNFSDFETVLSTITLDVSTFAPDSPLDCTIVNGLIIGYKRSGELIGRWNATTGAYMDNHPAPPENVSSGGAATYKGFTRNIGKGYASFSAWQRPVSYGSGSGLNAFWISNGNGIWFGSWICGYNNVSTLVNGRDDLGVIIYVQGSDATYYGSDVYDTTKVFTIVNPMVLLSKANLDVPIIKTSDKTLRVEYTLSW